MPHGNDRYSALEERVSDLKQNYIELNNELNQTKELIYRILIALEREDIKTITELIKEI